jgi:aryl-alcohol dehydrogenase-like predicted oxidoreductase
VAGETVRIGGREVRRIGFGAARLTGPGCWGPPEDRGQAIRLLRRAVELGVSFFDTADVYGPGVSEELIREALHPYRGVLIATKGGLVRTRPEVFRLDARPARLKQAAEKSLRRLGVDRIELYQLHRIDPRVPLADQLGALVELRDAGKIGSIGLSEVTVEELAAARGIVEIATVHNLYHLLDRSSDAVIDECRAHGTVFIPWYPLANGALARADVPLAALAGRCGATPAQLALAWLLHRAPMTLPIPGTASLAHLEENLGAERIPFSDETSRAVAAALSPPQ